MIWAQGDGGAGTRLGTPHPRKADLLRFMRSCEPRAVLCGHPTDLATGGELVGLPMALYERGGLLWTEGDVYNLEVNDMALDPAFAAEALASVDEGREPRAARGRDFSDDPGLERLLEGVAGADPRSRSAAFMAADFGGAREVLRRFLEPGGRTVRDVWLLLASELGLDVFALPGGREAVFPRVRFVRLAVDVGSGPFGSCSVRRYGPESACLVPSVDGDCPEALSALLDRCEEDAAGDGCSSVFVLVGDGEDGSLFAEMGYVPAGRKDDDRLSECLGARILYDYVVEKRLGLEEVDLAMGAHSAPQA